MLPLVVEFLRLKPSLNPVTTGQVLTVSLLFPKGGTKAQVCGLTPAWPDLGEFSAGSLAVLQGSLRCPHGEHAQAAGHGVGRCVGEVCSAGGAHKPAGVSTHEGSQQPRWRILMESATWLGSESLVFLQQLSAACLLPAPAPFPTVELLILCSG